MESLSGKVAVVSEADGCLRVAAASPFGSLHVVCDSAGITGSGPYCEPVEWASGIPWSLARGGKS
jgi:hypothetical protein